MRAVQNSLARLGVGLLCLALIPRCGDEVPLNRQATTQFFIQDYNPDFLDVLWVVDDRSPLFYAKSPLVKQAGRFFERLTALATYYQMGILSADMMFAKGALKSSGSTTIIRPKTGSPTEHTALFESMISRPVNLKTGPLNQAFQATQVSLSQYFKTRENVPLVLVFISDSDDKSDVSAAGKSAVDEYYAHFLSLKQNNASLLKIYSINYVPVPAGVGPDERISAYRCATQSDPDIDKAGFEDRFFKTALKSGGATANVCDQAETSGFASKIDLTGLRLKELPKRFKLDRPAHVNGFTVSVILNGADAHAPWTFDASSNEVVFEATPPEGSTIQITYFSE